MGRISNILLLILFLSCFAFPFDNDFKIIRIIGDERDDYFFYRISGAVLTPEKNIIISDSKGHFVSRYDWDGNFINRIGQKGKGPGDFYMPEKLDILNGTIYLVDKGNSRIVQMNSQLNDIQYFRLPQKLFSLEYYFNVLDDNRFIISSITIDHQSGNQFKDSFQGTDKIFFINKDAVVESSFFNQLPVDPYKAGIDKKKSFLFKCYSTVLYGLDKKNERILISFTKPDNPVGFYIYDFNGKLIKKIQLQLDKQYGFSYKVFKQKKLSLSALQGVRSINVNSIFYFKSHWYVFLEKTYYKTIEDPVDDPLYLKFDQDGNLKGSYSIANSFKSLYVSDEGYVLAKHMHKEKEELLIYKIIK